MISLKIGYTFQAGKSCHDPLAAKVNLRIHI